MGNVKWDIVKVFESFQYELETDTGFLPFFSPDFSLNLSVDH